jgi:predicted nucleotidyltransferase
VHPLISCHSPRIAALCRQYGVQRLELFGSLLRDAFNEATSDVDFTVEFQPELAGSSFERYFGLKADLESLFGRPVDLVELGAMPNTRLKRLIERARVAVYATTG